MPSNPVIGKTPSPVAEFTPSGSLAIIRRLFERAAARSGKITPQEALLGLDHVGKLEAALEAKHAERPRQGGSNAD